MGVRPTDSPGVWSVSAHLGLLIWAARARDGQKNARCRGTAHTRHTPTQAELPWANSKSQMLKPCLGGRKRTQQRATNLNEPTTALDAKWTRHARARRALLHSSMGRRHISELRPNERRHSASVPCIPEQCVPSGTAQRRPGDTSTPHSSTTPQQRECTTRLEHGAHNAPPHVSTHHSSPHQEIPCHAADRRSTHPQPPKPPAHAVSRNSRGESQRTCHCFRSLVIPLSPSPCITDTP